MFNSGNAAPSLADIAAVTKDNDGFGGNNGWWILIILFALFGGWGNWNRGGNGANEISYVMMPGGTSGGLGSSYRDVLATDFAVIERKLDGVNNGLCSLGYDQLSQMNGINTNIAAGFAGVNNAVCTLGYQNAQLINGVQTGIMQATNTLQGQLADCCCQNREATAQVRYDMATDTSMLNNAINQATQTIMQNCNANYRSLHDEMTAAKIEAKNETIAAQAAEIQALQLKASQADQNNYLINQLRPCPNPAYVVPNPYCNCGNAYAYTNYSGCCGNNNGGCCN